MSEPEDGFDIESDSDLETLKEEMCIVVTVLCDPDFESPEEDWEEEFGEIKEN